MSFKDNIIEFLLVLVSRVLIGCAVWFVIASTVWDFNNPKANTSTHITHIWDIFCMRKLDKFQ